MIIKTSLYLFCLLLSINCVYGYSKSVSSISWSQSAGSCCSSSYNLVDNSASSGQPWSGSAKCVLRDNTKPEILDTASVDYNEWLDIPSFTDTISITEKGTPAISGIDTLTVSIGDYSTETSENFSDTFIGSVEGNYNISLYAKDKSNYSNTDGAFSSSYNHDDNFNNTIKLDRSHPIILNYNTNGYTPNTWTKHDIHITGNISDEYMGGQAIVQNFDCTIVGMLPLNSERDNGENISGTCSKTDLINCDEDTQFNNNFDSCTYTCLSNYVQDGDVCIEKNKVFTCIDLDKEDQFYGYYYDEASNSNILYSGNLAGITEWSESYVSSDGSFESSYNASDNTYLPTTINSCDRGCVGDYHKGTNIDGGDMVGKCVSNYNIIKCIVPFLGEMGGAGGAANVGGGKNLDKIWNGNGWTYEVDDESFSNVDDACGYNGCVENSDCNTCNNFYYLTGDANSGYICEDVPIGQYSGQSNVKGDCTNFDGNNGHFTSNASSSNGCSWVCDGDGYYKSGNTCVKDTRILGDDWSGCSKTCGGGIKTKTVTCSGDNCLLSEKPSGSTNCNTQSCCTPYNKHVHNGALGWTDWNCSPGAEVRIGLYGLTTCGSTICENIPITAQNCVASEPDSPLLSIARHKCTCTCD